jgi:2-polyprenyl-3-methyl-5-hydroxy-6-metoxy-1,4-benzoquinol methylase
VPPDAGSNEPSSKVAAHFDKLYDAVERYWWRSDPRYSTDPDDYHVSLLTQQLLRLLRHRAPGRALDLGAGEGTDSIRLARLGCQVTAVEISQVAARKISKFASDAGVSVDVEVADISRYEPCGGFDVVICNGTLHYLPDKRPVIRRVQAATLPGAINAASTWSTFTPVPSCHEDVPVYPDSEDGVLAACYRDWNMKLWYFERNKPETARFDTPPHSHSHIKMIAEKPAAASGRSSADGH